MLFIIGTYIFWIFSYFVLVKFALGEINELKYAGGSIYQRISLNHVFSYLLYVGGVVLCMFIIKQLVVRAPNPKIAATIYAILIAFSAGVLILQLSNTVNILSILTHVLVNFCFLIAIVIPCVKFINESRRGQEEL